MYLNEETMRSVSRLAANLSRVTLVRSGTRARSFLADVSNLREFLSVLKPETCSLLIKLRELALPKRAFTDNSVPNFSGCWPPRCPQILICAVVSLIKGRHSSEIAWQRQTQIAWLDDENTSWS